ncbi:MAG: hypothetical protein K2I93_09310 [Oscillospiraceae bacterium]|nr:hypothetical protein [Oscillospiraceae bacterium]
MDNNQSSWKNDENNSQDLNQYYAYDLDLNVNNGICWKGLLGALIGCLPGLILWVIIGALGFTWSLVGMVIVIGAVFGYEKFGGTFANKADIIICIVLMIVAVYAGIHLTWAVELKNALQEYASEDVSLAGCVLNLHYVLGELDLTGSFIGSVVKGYLFAALGGFGALKKALH